MTTGNIKTWPHRHRFTAEEYNWMAEIGLLNGEPAVELIEGEIIHMAPMGTQHGNVVERLHADARRAPWRDARSSTSSVCSVSATSRRRNPISSC